MRPRNLHFFSVKTGLKRRSWVIPPGWGPPLVVEEMRYPIALRRLDTGTSEVSGKALFLSLRCCQPNNPIRIRQPGLSAGHGESAVLGFCLCKIHTVVGIA